MTENTEQYQNKCLNLWILQIDLNTLPVQLEMSAPKSEDDFSGCSKGGHMFTDLILFLLVEIHTPIKFTHQYLMACEDRFFNPMLKLSIQHFHIFFCIFFQALIPSSNGNLPNKKSYPLMSSPFPLLLYVPERLTLYNEFSFLLNFYRSYFFLLYTEQDPGIF